MKYSRQRIWIEDFRIYDNTEGRMVNSMMRQWKEARQRPTHFVRAILLYKALLDGDLNYFMQLLIDFAPRAAFRLMQHTGPGASGAIPDALAERIPIEREDFEIHYSEIAAAEKIDALADSLGLNDLSFD